MRTHRLAAAAAAFIAAAALVVTGPVGPAHAAKIFSDNFTDTFDSGPYDCDGLVTAEDTGTVHVVVMANIRGNSAFPLFREGDHGTVVTTNLATGRTLTQVFANNFHDATATDNGDGTFTLVSQGAGGTRFYDDTGKLVLKDPGSVRFSNVVDYNGTPADPSDDTFVDGTFQIVKPSTGHSDFSNRNFCEDLLTFTS